MKIVVFADLHLNKATYRTVLDRSSEFGNIPFRHVDFMKAFRWGVDECIKLKPDLVVIAGDIYDNPDPGNKVRGFFSEQLSRLVDSDIRVIIITGNHDVSQENHALTDIEKLNFKNLKVLSHPESIDYSVGSESAHLMFFPYSIEVERKIVSIKESLYGFLEKEKTKPKLIRPILFFGHFSVLGQRMNRYNVEDGGVLLTESTTTLLDNEQKEYLNRNNKDISPEDLDKIGADYIFLGDFHEKQPLKCRTRGWYGGSLEKNSFNEVEHEKGFIVYDSSIKEGEMGCCKFIAYPNCRPMLNLSGSLLNMKKQFSSIDISMYKEAIIRLNFYGNKKDKAEFEAGEDSFKEEMLSKTNAIHMYHNIGDVTDAETEIALSKIEKEIKENGMIEEADVIDVVKEMIFEREKDEQEREALVNMASNIYKKCTANRK